MKFDGGAEDTIPTANLSSPMAFFVIPKASPLSDANFLATLIS
ncbi:hypothetical protein [Rhizobium leguminosarum]|nr:hypothetical protein [Rhizobium leguminosarum]WFT88411.1 hypothetical protein QA638_12755 [Rhizobium leguminosarum]